MNKHKTREFLYTGLDDAYGQTLFVLDKVVTSNDLEGEILIDKGRFVCQLQIGNGRYVLFDLHCIHNHLMRL